MKPNNDQDEAEGFPIADSIESAILMHRDAHFGGNFDVMLNYYLKGGKGVFQEFEISKIQSLAQLEKQSQQNLAAMLLSGAEAERVAEARDAYKKLRDIYESKGKGSENARLIADLILSEEEYPEKEIEAIIHHKSKIVPLLIDLLRSEQFSDPLFPGYGFAPSLAALCLGKIGDKRAIISLFEEIGAGDYFDEDIALSALKAVGEPAKAFLLKVLHGRPLNEDNERAAIALIQFKNDPEVSDACLKMLQDPAVLKDLALSTYLILSCEGLSSEKERKEFLALAANPKLPKDLKRDMEAVMQAWQR